MPSFINNHADLTPEEIGSAMSDFLQGCGVAFDSNMPKTPENMNWMTVVYAIEGGFVDSVDDINNLLATIEKHYSGPISIHEGWGGCEADSNKELITEKLEFDLREFGECHHVNATRAAVELGWISSEYYEEVLKSIDA